MFEPRDPCTKLLSPLVIGHGSTAIRVPHRLFLAPMSGVSDLPFRRIAYREGAALVFSEMVASRELTEGHAESELRMAGEGLPVHAVQLAGREARWMGEAARRAEANGADLIDINMGCPAKKVTGGASGSALMRDLDHALTLIEATVAAVRVPVSVKMRLGWDEASMNAPDLARRAEGAGASMLTVHGRTRSQFYEGTANWDAVAAVVAAVGIPVVVNGDVRDPGTAAMAMARSGAAAVMIGRACYGQPWLVGSIAEALRGDRAHRGNERAMAVEHYEALLEHFGVPIGLRCARKHVRWYGERFGIDPGLLSEALRSDDPAFVRSVLGRDAPTAIAA